MPDLDRARDRRATIDGNMCAATVCDASMIPRATLTENEVNELSNTRGWINLMSDEHFRIEFYDARPQTSCATEADAHRVLGMSKGAIWWRPDASRDFETCRRDTNDSQEERDHRDAAWRIAYLEHA